MKNEQMEMVFEVKPPVSLLPAKGRPDPAVWIETLGVYKDWPPSDTNELRTFHLKKGLNILWAKPGARDRKKSGRPSRISGHATGKTTFSRLVRYALGDSNYGAQRAREAFQEKFPSGWVVAEVHLGTDQWLVGRPLGRIGHHPFAVMGQSIAWLKQQERRPTTGFEEYETALDTAGLGELSKTILPVGGERLRWPLLLQWLARDQESRFAELLTWRNKASDSEADELVQDDKRNLIRLVLGFVTDEEQKLIRKHAAAADQHKQAVAKRGQFEFQLKNDLRRLKEDLGVTLDGLQLGEIEDILEQQLVLLRERVRAIEQKRPAAEIVRAAKDELRGQDRIVDRAMEDQQEIEQLIAAASAKLEIAKGNTAKATQAAGTHSLPVFAGHCSHPLNEAWRNGCPLAKLRPEDEEFREALSKAKSDEDFLSIQIKQLQRDLEAKKRQVSERKMDRVPFAKKVADFEAADRVISDELTPLLRQLQNSERQRANVRETLTMKDENEASIVALEKKKRGFDDDLEKSKQLHVSRMGEFSRLYEFIAQQLLGEEVKASVDFSGKAIEPTLSYHGRLDSAALETVRLLAFDLAAMTASIVGSGQHPRFLLHDSPREADLSQGIYQCFFYIAQRLIEVAGGASKASFQYILTTTEPPPKSMQNEDWLICDPLDASQPNSRLLRVDF